MNLSTVKKLLLGRLTGSKKKDWEQKLNILLETELAKALKDDTPISEYLSITRLHEQINLYKEDEKCIQALYNMYTSEGWRYFSAHLRALQIFIEKKLATDMTLNEKEELATVLSTAYMQSLLLRNYWLDHDIKI